MAHSDGDAINRDVVATNQHVPLLGTLRYLDSFVSQTFIFLKLQVSVKDKLLKSGSEWPFDQV